MAILAVILAEICWALEPRNFSFPRSAETVQAIHAYQASPTVKTKAALLEQTKRDVSRNERPGEILLGLMLVADVAAVYFLWNYGAKKIAA